MALRLIFLLIVCMGCMGIVAAQDSVKRWQDSLKFSVGTVGTAASEDFLPFWLVANRYGTMKDRKNDVSTNIYIYNEHAIGKSDLQLSYTIDLFNNNHFNDFTLVEANVKVNYKGWQLRGGRYREVIGAVDPTLSSGSLGLSANALPIPKIGIAVTDYKNIPFTNGWLQFKGLFSHGWMGKDRYYESYLHEKAFFLRVGKGKLKLFGGAVHFGEWGGKRGNFSLDRSWTGFWDVLMVKEANDGSTPSWSNRRPNRAGDQRGTLEFGVDLETNYGDWHFYNQMFFESGTGIDIRNIDRLAGLSLTFKDQQKKIKKVLAEFIYTKQMEDYGKERQSYYNNGLYKTGWEYKGTIIGTPLFLNRGRGSHFLPIEPYNWQRNEDIEGKINGNTNIVSNRVIGLNVGAEYEPFDHFYFKTLLTYNVHFMDRSVIKKLVDDRYRQFYSLQHVSYILDNRWQLTGELAWDTGQFYHNFGISLGVKYTIF
uniref:Capsule assembly Wzi family protein n=1 Tax=Sphingobacterium sp. (strain 21) TaxID=743722 RepID=F4CA91_SPHS2